MSFFIFCPYPLEGLRYWWPKNQLIKNTDSLAPALEILIQVSGFLSTKPCASDAGDVKTFLGKGQPCLGKLLPSRAVVSNSSQRVLPETMSQKGHCNKCFFFFLPLNNKGLHLRVQCSEHGSF